ncbi:MAG: DUF427 domain-containing protein [Nitriliruptorales bacterium]
MALTMGTGPFGPQTAGVFNFELETRHVLYFEDSPRRVRVLFNGKVIADSRRVKLLHETGYLPVYYFPQQDVRMDVATPSAHHTHCPVRGGARYWTVVVGDRAAENALWSYPEPIEGAPPLAGYVAFYWDRMDQWFEEDEEVFVHPRDPYHRIDAIASSRQVTVSLDGRTLAESQRPTLLFETGLPVRYYLPEEDIQLDLLLASSARTRCPYKGIASYRSVHLGDQVISDVVWSYPSPNPAVTAIAGLLCFYNERVDLKVDGEPQPRPRTPFA